MSHDGSQLMLFPSCLKTNNMQMVFSDTGNDLKGGVLFVAVDSAYLMTSTVKRGDER